MGADLGGWVAGAVLASIPQAAVSPCTKTRRGNEPVGVVALAIAVRQRSHLGLRVHLPKDMNKLIEWREPSRPGNPPLALCRGAAGEGLMGQLVMPFGRRVVTSSTGVSTSPTTSQFASCWHRSNR
jgi:hypothetical protein